MELAKLISVVMLGVLLTLMIPSLWLLMALICCQYIKKII